MSIRGKFAIDVQFWDRTSSDGVDSMKAISLQDIGEYAEGKVAVVSGTLGTATATIAVAPCSYKDSAGNAVSFATINRVAFTGDRRIILKNAADMAVICGPLLPAVSDAQDNAGPLRLFPGYTSGSATYTLVIYGT